MADKADWPDSADASLVPRPRGRGLRGRTASSTASAGSPTGACPAAAASSPAPWPARRGPRGTGSPRCPPTAHDAGAAPRRADARRRAGHAEHPAVSRRMRRPPRPLGRLGPGRDPRVRRPRAAPGQTGRPAVLHRQRPRGWLEDGIAGATRRSRRRSTNGAAFHQYASGTTGPPRGDLPPRGAYLQAAAMASTPGSARVPGPSTLPDVPLQRLVRLLGRHRGRRRPLCLRRWTLPGSPGSCGCGDLPLSGVAPTVLTMIAEDPAAGPLDHEVHIDTAARRRRLPCWPGSGRSGSQSGPPVPPWPRPTGQLRNDGSAAEVGESSGGRASRSRRQGARPRPSVARPLHVIDGARRPGVPSQQRDHQQDRHSHRST